MKKKDETKSQEQRPHSPIVICHSMQKYISFLLTNMKTCICTHTEFNPHTSHQKSNLSGNFNIECI
jgi:hypothetical protein